MYGAPRSAFIDIGESMMFIVHLCREDPEDQYFAEAICGAGMHGQLGGYEGVYSVEQLIKVPLESEERMCPKCMEHEDFGMLWLREL